MTAVVDPSTAAHPFLDIRQAAYFLETTINRVRVLHRRGELVEAMLGDGTPFRPTGVLLFRAIDVGPAIAPHRQTEFVEWQHGLLEISFSDVQRSRSV